MTGTDGAPCIGLHGLGAVTRKREPLQVIARSAPLGAAHYFPRGMGQAMQLGEAANESSSYCPLPALRR